eukprot:6742110-Pyramimonas_sp.AAC.5
MSSAALDASNQASQQCTLHTSLAISAAATLAETRQIVEAAQAAYNVALEMLDKGVSLLRSGRLPFVFK